MNIRGKGSAVLLGGSGLVGGFCMKALLANPAYGRIVLLNRRELPVAPHPRMMQRIVNFENLAVADFEGADDIFCALGTTIRKAGTQEAFRRVDLEFPLAAARRGLQAGTKQFVLVSSVGADPASKSHDRPSEEVSANPGGHGGKGDGSCGQPGKERDIDS